MAVEREIDIAARVLVRKHGQEAVDHAKRMLRRYARSADAERTESWRRIVKAVENLIAVARYEDRS